MNRDDNLNIINSRIGGRRSTDLNKVGFTDPIFIDDNKIDDLLMLLSYARESEANTFREWYYEGGFNQDEYKLKNLLRLYRKRNK